MKRLENRENGQNELPLDANALDENALDANALDENALDETLCPRDERVLVAVSGGADSVALLLALHQNGLRKNASSENALRENSSCENSSCENALRETDRQIFVAHVNHGLRGRESDDDETFVRELCATLAIEYSMRRVVVPQRNNSFREDDARQLRYGALIEIAREKSCATIATGHTADDNLETILLHMARGATTQGWSGIPPIRVLENDLRVVRPILGWTRAQTEAFCRANKIAWREDSSNSSTRFARNRVRNEVVPLLAQIGNRSRETLARQTLESAILRREESAFLDEMAREKLTDLRLEGKPNALTFDGVGFARLPIALQRRVLRLALRAFDLRDVAAEQSEEMRRQVCQKSRRRVWCLARGVRLEWTGDASGNRVRVWRVERSDNDAERNA